MSERSIRRHITLSPTENEIINNFIKKQGVSFSEFLRLSALKSIKESENLNLKENNVLEYQGSSKKGKWIIKK